MLDLRDGSAGAEHGGVVLCDLPRKRTGMIVVDDFADEVLQRRPEVDLADLIGEGDPTLSIDSIEADRKSFDKRLVPPLAGCEGAPGTKLAQRHQDDAGNEDQENQKHRKDDVVQRPHGDRLLFEKGTRAFLSVIQHLACAAVDIPGSELHQREGQRRMGAVTIDPAIEPAPQIDHGRFGQSVHARSTDQVI